RSANTMTGTHSTPGTDTVTDPEDELELPRVLGIVKSDDLFGPRAELCASTSAIRYPVFVGRKNFTGHAPEILKQRGASVVHRERAALQSLGVPEGSHRALWRCSLGVPCSPRESRQSGSVPRS